MVYLHEDREQFLQALRLTYKQTRQMMQIIEKDYYVTVLLKLLAEKIPFIVFKGGTKLYPFVKTNLKEKKRILPKKISAPKTLIL